MEQQNPRKAFEMTRAYMNSQVPHKKSVDGKDTDFVQLEKIRQQSRTRDLRSRIRFRVFTALGIIVFLVALFYGVVNRVWELLYS